MAGDDVRYGIGELATLGGVSRRTVRYYVQEGLLPAPFGLGRGDHYGPAHLERLQQVKALQEAGHTLDDIRRDLRRDTRSGREAMRAAMDATGEAAPPPRAAAMPRAVWHRLTVAPGVELHMDHTVTLPSPTALRELADWCQRHLRVAAARPEHKD